MKVKSKLLGKFLSFVLALAMVFSGFGMLPGMVQEAHASSVEETWSDNQTIESTKTINGGVGVNNDVVLTINKGVTLTINNGLYIGAALTVKGEGTLVVNGHNGSNGSDDWGDDSGGGNGSDGESAINGNIIVEGGKVTVTGGRGGSGGYGGFFGGDGGYGGYGIKGNLTVNGGSVTVTGGSGGSGGTTSPVGDAGSNGSNAKAINGNISGATGLVAEESKDGSIWNYITGGSSEHQFVRAKVLEPVTVKIDVGEGHASLFTSDVLNQIKTLFELEDVTISGNIVTLKGVHPSTTEYDMWYVIADFVNDLVEPANFMHNKEWFRDPAYKPIDEYATSSDFDNDIYDAVHESTPVSEGLTYYLFWAKPYEKLEIDNGNPTCGNEMWKAFPTVPDGFMVDPEDSVWRDENGERVGTFEGGKTYTFSGRIYLRPNNALWKYFLDEDNFTLTVKDGKDVEYSVNNNWINLTFKATADHDWDEGKVTKEATCTEKGEKTFACKYNDEDWHKEKPATKTEEIAALGHKYGAWTKLDDKQHQRVCENDKSHVEKANHIWDAGKVTKEATETAEGVKTYTCTVCKATKTESIPKPTPVKSTVKPVLVAKAIASGKTAANISWNKIKDADRYEIYMSKCKYKGKKYTMKKVKTVNGKTFKWTKKGLKKNVAYKFYVKALKKSGKNYKAIVKSKVGHFFTGNVRNELTNPKSLKLKKSKITLKKGKTATIKGTVTKVKKNKKLATGHAAKLRFTSNNPSVAKVNAKGKVTAKKAGTAKIYVQTINGIWKTCKVTVN